MHKTQYDGAGRQTADFATDGAGDHTDTQGWQDAQGVTSMNHVLTQTETLYDLNSNPILVTTRDRFHDATAVGVLVYTTHDPKARVSYMAMYYDLADRPTDTVDFGTYGALMFSRPATVPAPSDTVLVTHDAYVADTVETVALTGSPTSGNFTLTFNGQTTQSISFNASAATVQSKLAALQNIGVGNVAVTGPGKDMGTVAGGPWAVRFTGTLAGMIEPLMTGSASGFSVVVSLSSQAGDAGRIQTVTDPRAISSKTDYDLMGRSVRTVQAFNNNPTVGTNWNTATDYSYDGDSHMLTLTAYPGDGSLQRTQYVYNVTNVAGSGWINSNDLLSQVQFPDKTTGLPSTNAGDQETYRYDNLAETNSMTQRTGTVHGYVYDILGRLTIDSVTTLGANVDGAVRTLALSYDPYGNVFALTSLDVSVHAVNQIQRAFNGLGQLTAETQYHGDPANMSTPHGTVAYSYNLMAGGANNSRLLSMTYPNTATTRQVNYTYGTSGSVDDMISRPTAISDGATTLEGYSYLGLGTVVQRLHPESGINLTYINPPNGSTDGGDQYTGLDRFGRVVDQLWTGPTTSTDDFTYGYDRNGNRLYRNNLKNTAFGELYHASGPGNGYDPLNQMSAFSRGVLSASPQGGGVLDTIATPLHSQTWSLDALGNWTNVTTDGNAQARTHNPQNEIATITGQTNPAYDNNGNTTTDDTGKHYVYDAWNRIVSVSGASSPISYAYDVLGRRIQETENSTTRDLYFSQQWQVLEEDVGGTMQDQYVWSPVYVDALIERDAGGQRLYVQQDANWNVTALVNTSGAPQERYVYDPYGKVTILDASWGTRTGSSFAWVYLHQGGRYDIYSGLYSFRNRDFSPSLGRWMELDPMGYGAGDNNLYRYLGNGPTAFVDPLGLADIPLGCGYYGRVDVMGRPGGTLGGHIHIFDRNGKEVAKINERGGYAGRHKGKALLKPSQLPKEVRNRAGRIARQIGTRALGIIGIGVGLFFFAGDAKAEGVDKATAGRIPVLGELITLTDIVDQATTDAYEDLNAHVRQGHQKAAVTVKKFLDYELSTRKCPNPDFDRIASAARAFYDEVQVIYTFEAATGRAANINDAVKDFQDNLDKACACKSK